MNSGLSKQQIAVLRGFGMETEGCPTSAEILDFIVRFVSVVGQRYVSITLAGRWNREPHFKGGWTGRLWVSYHDRTKTNDHCISGSNQQSDCPPYSDTQEEAAYWLAVVAHDKYAS